MRFRPGSPVYRKRLPELQPRPSTRPQRVPSVSPLSMFELPSDRWGALRENSASLRGTCDEAIQPACGGPAGMLRWRSQWRSRRDDKRSRW